MSTKPWKFYTWRSKEIFFSFLQGCKVLICLAWKWRWFYSHTIVGFHTTSLKFKRVLGFVKEYAWVSKLLRDVAMIYMTYFGEFCYLNSLWIRKSMTLLFMSSSTNIFTLLYPNSVHHVGAHPGGHQRGVSILGISINLGKTFLRISRIRNILLTWILARNLLSLPPFISQIPDFIYWMVLILILIYFELHDTEN